MTDIVEFIRARLDEDEAAAGAASAGPWRFNPRKQWLAEPDETRRALLAQYAAVLGEVRAPTSAEHYANARARQFQLEQALPLLALPYVDHPGWREEWRP